MVIDDDPPSREKLLRRDGADDSLDVRGFVAHRRNDEDSRHRPINGQRQRRLADRNPEEARAVRGPGEFIASAATGQVRLLSGQVAPRRHTRKNESGSSVRWLYVEIPYGRKIG